MRKTIKTIKRLKNSVYGNPAFEITRSNWSEGGGSASVLPELSGTGPEEERKEGFPKPVSADADRRCRPHAAVPGPPWGLAFSLTG